MMVLRQWQRAPGLQVTISSFSFRQHKETLQSRIYHWRWGIKQVEIRQDSLAVFNSSRNIIKKCFELCHAGQVSLQLVRTYCASKCQDKLYCRTSKLCVTLASKRQSFHPPDKKLLPFPSRFISNCSYANQNTAQGVWQRHYWQLQDHSLAGGMKYFDSPPP